MNQLSYKFKCNKCNRIEQITAGWIVSMTCGIRKYCDINEYHYYLHDDITLNIDPSDLNVTKYYPIDICDGEFELAESAMYCGRIE